MAGFSTTIIQSISASLDAAWTAWSTSEGMDGWFSTNTAMDFREGGYYTNGDGDRCQYLSIVPREQIKFSWTSRDHAPGSAVTVEFADAGSEGVTVTLVHDDLNNQEDAYDLTEGWSWATASLKSYLETGKPIGFEEWKAARARERV